MRDVFVAVASALPPGPAGGGPFAWSGDGALRSLLLKAGFQLTAEGGSRCGFHYPGFEKFWRAQSSAGNYQPALQAVGADRLRELVAQSVRPYTQASGSIVLRNVYRWAAGQAV